MEYLFAVLVDIAQQGVPPLYPVEIRLRTYLSAVRHVPNQLAMPHFISKMRKSQNETV